MCNGQKALYTLFHLIPYSIGLKKQVTFQITHLFGVAQGLELMSGSSISHLLLALVILSPQSSVSFLLYLPSEYMVACQADPAGDAMFSNSVRPLLCHDQPFLQKKVKQILLFCVLFLAMFVSFVALEGEWACACAGPQGCNVFPSVFQKVTLCQYRT